ESERYCYNTTLCWNPDVEKYFAKAYGADHFSRISAALTRPSCYSCIRVNELKTTTDAVFKKLLAVLEERRPQDDSVMVETNVKSDDTASNSTSGKYSVSKCDIPSLDYVILVKGSGPHSIDYGHEADKPLKEVCVSRKCAEAVLRGAHVYVPGVLACSAHLEKGETVAVSVAMEQPSANGGWGVGFTRGTVLQGSETGKDGYPYHSERRGLYIGQGNSMLSRAGLFRVSQGLAIDMKKRVFDLPSFYDVLEGEIFLQNLPSIIAAHVLDPREGEKIFDMCAAPGGKTTGIAALMKDKGEVIAADRSHKKVRDIQKLASELNLKCITPLKLDALKSIRRINGTCHHQVLHIENIQTPDLSSLQIQQMPVTSSMDCKLKHILSCVSFLYPIHDLFEPRSCISRTTEIINSLGGRAGSVEGFLSNSFHRILLDAPCSALGLRPRLFTGEDTLESLRTHAKYQKRMFDQAVQLVRPGGVIVYSTCTINPGENEAVVRYALDTYKFLSLAPQHPKVGGPGLVGGFSFADGYEE
ncbi:hypothetical protein M569_08974, partial [Genlisea aurea]